MNRGNKFIHGNKSGVTAVTHSTLSPHKATHAKQPHNERHYAPQQTTFDVLATERTDERPTKQLTANIITMLQFLMVAMQDSAVSIDPPGSSFNGYEEKPPISNHTQQQLGTVGNNTIANKGTDVSEITTPSVFLEEENQNSNSAIDIENLVASTQANLEHTFDTCIYTILEKLESEVS